MAKSITIEDILKLRPRGNFEENVDYFYEKIKEMQKDEAKEAENTPKLNGLDLDNMTRNELLLVAKAHFVKCIKSPEGYDFTPGLYYYPDQDFEGITVMDDNNNCFFADYDFDFEKYFKNE